MPMTLEADRIVLHGSCSVEEAEAIQACLLDNPDHALDLSLCDHVHTAVLQVLRAAHAPIAALPEAPFIRLVLECALPTFSQPYVEERADEVRSARG